MNISELEAYINQKAREFLSDYDEDDELVEHETLYTLLNFALAHGLSDDRYDIHYVISVEDDDEGNASAKPYPPDGCNDYVWTLAGLLTEDPLPTYLHATDEVIRLFKYFFFQFWPETNEHLAALFESEGTHDKTGDSSIDHD